MKDVKSLELKEKENGKPTVVQLAQIKAEIGELKEAFLAQADIREGQPVEQPSRETAVQKLFREAEEGRSPDELKQAEQWVIRQIGGRLKVQQGPAAVAGGDPVPEIVFDKYVVTQELKDSGKTTLPIGFTVCHNMPAPALARYYIKIILDMDSYQNDAEKLLAIVEDSKERGTHPTEFGFLFDAAGQLKPLNRGRRRKRTC